MKWKRCQKQIASFLTSGGTAGLSSEFPVKKGMYSFCRVLARAISASEGNRKGGKIMCGGKVSVIIVCERTLQQSTVKHQDLLPLLW